MIVKTERGQDPVLQVKEEVMDVVLENTEIISQEDSDLGLSVVQRNILNNNLFGPEKYFKYLIIYLYDSKFKHLLHNSYWFNYYCYC